MIFVGTLDLCEPHTSLEQNSHFSRFKKSSSYQLAFIILTIHQKYIKEFYTWLHMGIKVNIIVSALIDWCIQSEFIQMRGKGKKRKGKLVEGGKWSKDWDRDRLKSSGEGQRTIPELHSDIMAGSCRDEMEKGIHSENTQQIGTSRTYSRVGLAIDFYLSI